MKLIKILLYLFAFSLLASSYLGAQTIQLQMDSSPSPYLSDWEFIRETALLIVSNDTSDEIEAKISSQLYRGTSDLIAETTLSDMPIQYFPPGVSTYYPEDMVPFDAIDVHDSSIEESVIRTGMIPADTYTLCINLVDPSTNQPLLDEPACQTFLITSYQPPVLLQPVDGEEVFSEITLHPDFVWVPVIPAPDGVVNYRLTVFEILEDQYPAEAFRSNTAIIDEYIVGMTQFIWPAYYPDPEVGMSYVWGIQALDSQDRPIGEPEGRSELFTFHMRRTGRNPQTGTTMSLAVGLDPEPQGTLTVLGKDYYLLKPLDEDDELAKALIFGKTTQPVNPTGDLPKMEKVEVDKFQYREQFGQSGRSRVRDGEGPVFGVTIYTNLFANNTGKDSQIHPPSFPGTMKDGDPIPGIDLTPIQWLEYSNAIEEQEEGFGHDLDNSNVAVPGGNQDESGGSLTWVGPCMTEKNSSGKKGYDYWQAKADMNKAMFGSKKGYDYYMASSDQAAASLKVKVKFKAGSDLSKKVNAWDTPLVLLYNLRTAELEDVESMDDTGEFWFLDVKPGEFVIIIDDDNADDITGFTVTNLGDEVSVDGSELYLKVVYHGDALKDIFALEDLGFLDPDDDGDGLGIDDDDDGFGDSGSQDSNEYLDPDSDGDTILDDGDGVLDDDPIVHKRPGRIVKKSSSEGSEGYDPDDDPIVIVWSSTSDSDSNEILDPDSDDDGLIDEYLDPDSDNDSFSDGDDPLLRKRPGRVKYGNITLERINNNELTNTIMQTLPFGRDKIEIVLDGFINAARMWNKRKLSEELLRHGKENVFHVSDKEFLGHVTLVRGFDSECNTIDEWTPIMKLTDKSAHNRRPLDPATVTSEIRMNKGELVDAIASLIADLETNDGSELRMNKGELVDAIASLMDDLGTYGEDGLYMNKGELVDAVASLLEYLHPNGEDGIRMNKAELIDAVASLIDDAGDNELRMNKGELIDALASTADLPPRDVELIIDEIILNLPFTLDAEFSMGQRHRPLDGKNEAGEWKAQNTDALDDDDDGDSVPTEIGFTYQGNNIRKDISVIALQLPGVDDAVYDINVKSSQFYFEGSAPDSRSPYAIESRDVLKTYFETGDIPTEQQFYAFIDATSIELSDGIDDDCDGVEMMESSSPEIDDEVLVIFGNQVLRTIREGGRTIGAGEVPKIAEHYNEGWNLFVSTDREGNSTNFALNKQQTPDVIVRGWDLYYLVSKELYHSGDSNALKVRHDTMMCSIRNMR